MDVNNLRVVVMVMSFGAFIAIVVWVLARRNAARFEAAAQLPFAQAGDVNPPAKPERFHE